MKVEVKLKNGKTDVFEADRWDSDCFGLSLSFFKDEPTDNPHIVRTKAVRLCLRDNIESIREIEDGK